MITKAKIRKVLVVGLGSRTGLAAANFFVNKGVKVFVSDQKKREELLDVIDQLPKGVVVITGPQTIDILKNNFDLIVLSPGVPKEIPLIKEALNRQVPVISEVELAFHYLLGDIIAITGTDGKTTTTSLTGHLFKKLGFKSLVGGNIGIPLISLVDKTDENSIIVAELSSFQLETIVDFKPKVAVFLNFSPDHLDRYDDLAGYLAAKERIILNQDENNYFIYNQDDQTVNDLKKGLGKPLSFSLQDKKAEAFYEDGYIWVKKSLADSISDTQKVISKEDLPFLGEHNIQNAMAAILIFISWCQSKGLEVDLQKIAGAISSFQPLPHRLEKIGNLAGRIFINDSKATTVNAVSAALKSFGEPVILLMGGRGKGDDYQRLVSLLKERVKLLVLFGEARNFLADLYKGSPVVLAETLEEATQEAFSKSQPGDVLLLSPACASFDQFSNFEERGDRFKKIFQELV